MWRVRIFGLITFAFAMWLWFSDAPIGDRAPISILFVLAALYFEIAELHQKMRKHNPEQETREPDEWQDKRMGRNMPPSHPKPPADPTPLRLRDIRDGISDDKTVV